MLVGVVVVALILVAMIAGIYNKLVALRNRYKNAYAQIDVQLKRRYDLIPNLVETAKGYMAHERGTLEAVISARNQAQAAQQKASANPADGAAISGLVGAESMLTGALGRLFAVVENYPNLKANENFNRLQDELAGTENRIAVERMRFNETVQAYNTLVKTFPTNIVARLVGFVPNEAYFKATEAAQAAPQVKF